MLDMTRSVAPRLLVACIAAIGFLFPPPSRATPPSRPTLAWPPGGVPVVQQPGDQLMGDIVGDGRGGAFVAWLDLQAGANEHDIYLQRVEASGRIAWPGYATTGLPVCTAPKKQVLVRLAPDAAEGVIATWHDERGTTPDIYALRITSNGMPVPSWPVDGAPICTAAGTQTDPVIAQDGSGGAYIAWEDFRDSFANGRIFAQRVLDDGTTANPWPNEGVRLANGTGIEFQPAILPDFMGGAFVIWVRYWPALGNSDLIATRVTPSGAVAPGWPDSGLAICSAPGRQDSPSIVPDRQGGFYAVWRDYRNDPDLTDGAESDIFCQRVTGLGEFPPGWGGDGIAVRVAGGDERIPKAAPDGWGGLLVSWQNPVNGLSNVFVQRITAEGTVSPGWDPAGVATGTTTAIGQGPALVGDGAGGAIVAWEDDGGPSLADVYAQHIQADGTRATGWDASGLPIAASSDKELLGGATALISTIVGDGSGGAVVAWTAWDEGGSADLFVQRVMASGVVGPRACAGCDGILSLSPNPGTGRFRLQVKGPDGGSSAEVKIYDLAGRLRREIEFAGLPAFGVSDLDIDLSDFPAGVYFVRYSTGGGAPVVGLRQLTIVR